MWIVGTSEWTRSSGEVDGERYIDQNSMGQLISQLDNIFVSRECILWIGLFDVVT